MFGMVVVGFLVGGLVGLTGMGGGLLMTPLLIVLYGFSPSMAIGTDLMYASITKWVGGWQHLRQNSVHLSLVGKLALGSIPGSLLGVGMIALLNRFTQVDVDHLLGQLLGFTFIGVALFMIYHLLAGRITRSPEPSALTGGDRLRFIILGFVGGMLVGLTSVGSGTVFMAALLLFSRLPPALLVGTDIFHGAILTTVAGLAHLSIGTVDLGFLIPLLLGSIPGIILGSRLTLRVPEHLVRIFLVFILFLTGLKLI